MRKIKYYIFSIAYLVFLFARYGDMDALEQLRNDTQAMVEETVEKATVDIQVQAAIKESGTILRVIDGDTYVIVINGKGTTVRLIGVDTPESVAYNGKLVNTEYGKKASQYAKELLPEGTQVWLQYDKETEDDYGRTLAYVYTKDANGATYMINKRLVEEGYARAVYYSPNDKYRKKLKECHLQAKENEVGFWGWQETTDKSFEAAFPGKYENDY